MRRWISSAALAVLMWLAGVMVDSYTGLPLTFAVTVHWMPVAAAITVGIIVWAAWPQLKSIFGPVSEVEMEQFRALLPFIEDINRRIAPLDGKDADDFSFSVYWGGVVDKLPHLRKELEALRIPCPDSGRKKDWPRFTFKLARCCRAGQLKRARQIMSNLDSQYSHPL